MDNVTVEQALKQGVVALQQVEEMTEGTPLAGLAYAAALLIMELITAITSIEAAKADAEEEN